VEGYVIEFAGTVEASFSASHWIKGHPRCGRPHGHRWRVAVTIRTGQDPKTGELVGLPELADAVEQLCGEVDREDVNTMFPASHPTAAGVALAFRERLVMHFLDIEEITVWMDNVGATVRA
jgi:6-pyruvoyl-tetrahydropterin synthase